MASQPRVRLLIVAPTKRELGGVRPGERVGRHVATVGIGHEATPALKRLLDTAHPTVVLSLGFAGGLEPKAGTGDVVVCTTVRRVDAEPIEFDAAPVLSALRDAGISHEPDTLLTVDKPLLTQPEKWRARADSGAAVADMEGFALAEAAKERGIAFHAIRVVLDKLNQDLPAFVGKIIADGGRGEWRHSLRALAAQPTLAGQMLKLASQARQARQSMARAVRAVVPALEAGTGAEA